ncbi:MAG: hypothetical protein E7050_08475 [Lentisphaerae bacterium]|nr:hypothetical protein [Lentisphaerota bacterium]
MSDLSDSAAPSGQLCVVCSLHRLCSMHLRPSAYTAYAAYAAYCLAPPNGLRSAALIHAVKQSAPALGCAEDGGRDFLFYFCS